MKRSPIILMILSMALIAMVISSVGLAATKKVVLQIEGMVWATWPFIIKKALEGLDGVEKADSSFSKKRGEILFDPEKVSEAGIVNKVNEIGFSAKVIEE